MAVHHRRLDRGERFRSPLVAIPLVLGAVFMTACGSQEGAQSHAGSARSGSAGQSDVGNAQGRTQVKMAFSSTPMSLGPALVAVTQNAFQKEGVDPDIKIVPSSTNVVSALLSGSIDVGVLGAATVVDADAEGADMQFIAGLTTNEVYIAAADDYAKKAGVSPAAPLNARMAALKGATIGTATPGSSIDQALRAMLRSAGLDPERDVHIRNTSDFASLSAGLRNGQFDAIASAIGFGIESNFADKSGVLWAAPDDFPKLNGLFAAVAAKKSWISSHPDAVQAIYEAIAGATKHADAAPGDTRAALKAKYFAQESPAAFKVAYHLAQESFLPQGKIPADTFAILADQQKAAGKDTSDLTYEGLVIPSVRSSG